MFIFHDIASCCFVIVFALFENIRMSAGAHKYQQ